MRQTLKRFERTPDDRYDMGIDTNIKPFLAEGVALQPSSFHVLGPKQDPPTDP